MIFRPEAVGISLKELTLHLIQIFDLLRWHTAYEGVSILSYIYARQLCIPDKHITCSCIKQNLVLLRCQQD